MKTAPKLKLYDAPVSSYRYPIISPNRKRKQTEVLKKEGSASKVVRKLPSEDDNSDVEEFQFDSDEDIEASSWECLLDREDGKQIDMDVVDKYLLQVEDSEGFDIIDFPGHIEGITNVIPRQGLLDNRHVLHEKFGRVMICAKLAIASYNKAKQTKFEVLDIEKLNSRFCKATTYYMTFSGVDAKLAEQEMHGEDGPPKRFQAKVVDDLVDGTRAVVFCRPLVD